MTQWGYEECTATPRNGAHGAWLPKRTLRSVNFYSLLHQIANYGTAVLQRNLPRNYPYDNVYSLFPLIVPDKAIEQLKLLDPNSEAQAETKYDVNRPQAPEIIYLDRKDSISYAFTRHDIFLTTYGERLKRLSKEYGYDSFRYMLSVLPRLTTMILAIFLVLML